jgi:hypothetical protein
MPRSPNIALTQHHVIFFGLPQNMTSRGFAHGQVYMFHGADRATLLTICQDGFDPLSVP